MTRLVLFFLCLSGLIVFRAEAGRINGGMFYHCGAGSVVLPDGNRAAGITTGLGGRLAFALRPFLRVGGMGFNSTFPYTSPSGIAGSHIRLSCGGVTAEFVLPPVGNRTRLSFGSLLGGGRVTVLHTEALLEGKLLVDYRKYSSFVLMPLILAEFRINDKISLALMGDWIFGNRIAAGNSFGPRGQIGLLFNR